MPISGEQFDKGLDKTRYLLLEFLEKNPDKAYKVEEIVEGISVSTGTSNIVRVNQDIKNIVSVVIAILLAGSILDGMSKEGLIDKKVIDGESYYRIHEK